MQERCQCRPYFFRGSFIIFNSRSDYLKIHLAGEQYTQRTVCRDTLVLPNITDRNVVFFHQGTIKQVCVTWNRTHVSPKFMVRHLITVYNSAFYRVSFVSCKFKEEIRVQGDEMCQDCLPCCSDTWYEPEISHASFPGNGFNQTRTFKRLVEQRNLSSDTDSNQYFK